VPIVGEIIVKVEEYELKAKWAHFVKAEIANPEVCVFRPNFFDELEKVCDTLMKETIAPDFFKSPAFQEFLRANPNVAENMKKR
jgi:hypothetical protein